MSIDKQSARFTDITRKATEARLALEHWPSTVLNPKDDLWRSLPPKGIGNSNFTDRTMKTFNLGAIGCYLTHRALLEHISKKNSSSLGTLILEDDAEITPGLFQKLSIIEKELPADWDILFLDKHGGKSEIPVSKHIFKIKESLDPTVCHGAYAYIVKNSSIKTKILPKLKHMTNFIDIQYTVNANTINQYIAYGIITVNKEHNDKSTVVANDLKDNTPWVIVQYDNRPIPQHYKKLIEVNKEYCKKYGYEYVLRTEVIDLPPWWIKVKLCKELLETNKYKGVMWLDVDAAFYDCSKSIDEFISNYPNKEFFIAKDPPEWAAPVNAGIWIVKNTDLGKKIMLDWFSHYNKDKWVKNNSVKVSSEQIDSKRWVDDPLLFKWYIDVNLSKKEREWAGINFEQGALYEKTIQNPLFNKYIMILPNIVFSYWEPEQSRNSFTAHFFTAIKNITPYSTEHYIERFLRERIKC